MYREALHACARMRQNWVAAVWAPRMRAPLPLIQEEDKEGKEDCSFRNFWKRSGVR